MATLGGSSNCLPDEYRKMPVKNEKASEAVSDITKLLMDRLLEDMPTAEELWLWLQALESLIPKKLKTERDEFMAWWYWIVYPNYVIEKSYEPIPTGHRTTLRNG